VNRKKLSLRRPLGILGATILGVTAAVALASPASAHHSTVAGSTWCNPETGNWDITWTVNSYAPADVERFQLTSVELTPAGTTVTNIAASSDSDDFPYHTDATLYGHQLLPGDTDATEATLAVKAKWSNGFEEETGSKGTVKIEGTCKKKDTPPPTTPPPAPDVTDANATFAPACDGTVEVTLINGDDATVPVELTVSAKGFTQTHTVEPKSEKTGIIVPAGAGAITVTEKGKDTPVTKPFTWERPEDCGEPTLAYASTCEEFLFEVTNPKDGAPITVTFTPSTGDAQTITVAPGDVEVVKFPASEGLTVTPSAEGTEGEPLAWEPEESCGGGGGGGPELPVTGVAAGGIAGGALVLLAIGAVLFFMARRRRMTFTA
jgi:hypothetical protein